MSDPKRTPIEKVREQELHAVLAAQEDPAKEPAAKAVLTMTKTIRKQLPDDERPKDK